MIEWLKKATGRNITGNYKFHIKSEPEIVDNASTIIVTPYSDRSESAIVPCHYRWFRMRNGIKEQSYKYRGNSYVCDSADIGAIIVAEVISNDPQYSGQATVQFGPVKLSVEIKKNLTDTLANGSTLMRGFISQSEYQEKQCDFKIFEDMIKIRHLQSQLNYSFNYSPYQPRIQSNPKDPTKISILFNQNQDSNPHIFLHNLFNGQYQGNNANGYGECRMEIRFINRQIKDIFLLTLKAFFTKKQLKNSVVIHKLQEANFSQKEDIDLLFEVQSLKSDVSRLYVANQQKQRERLRLSQQVNRLQRDMQEIVTTYTRIADQKMKSSKDLNESYALLMNKKEDVFGRKCQNLQRQNMNLNDRIKLLSAQIDQIRFNSSMVKKNQTINPNFTQITAIRVPSQIGAKPDATTFENILENLNESRVTSFNEQSFKMTKQLQKVQDQKSQLERKLEKSFRMIDDLEKKLKNQNNVNQSAVYNFHKKQFQPEINTSTYSLAVDMQKIQNEKNKIQIENNRLVQMVDSLKKQNMNLKNQVNSGTGSRIIIKPQMIGNNSNQAMKTSMSLQKQTNNLQAENESLKREILSLRLNLKNEEGKTERYLKDKIILQRKVSELQSQISMLRRSQEVLNRSQHLSMQMQSYNDDKIKSLQDNNRFLLSENQKLSKAVQKFMLEAKQNIQLRKQLLQLKQKLNQKTLNPQKQAKSVLSNSAYNAHNVSEYSEVMIGVHQL